MTSPNPPAIFGDTPTTELLASVHPLVGTALYIARYCAHLSIFILTDRQSIFIFQSVTCLFYLFPI